MGQGYSDFGEAHIKRGLAAKGWFVIETGKIQTNGAPMAQSCGDALIIPDLQILAGGKTRWVEVKRKTNPAFMHIEQCYKHGFCKRQWEHYMLCEYQAGVQVWLFIWEVENRIICYAPLQYLLYPQFRLPGTFKRQSVNGTQDFCEHGMAFFRRDDFWKMDEQQFLAGEWNDTWIKNR